MKKHRLSLLNWAINLSVIFLLTSCEKGPGEGGTSTITGKIFVMNYNGAGELVGQYYGQEEHVYIIYGDASYFGNDVKTGYDGTYEFDFLRKGSYTIYAYSKCDTCQSGQEPTMITTEVTKNHSTVTLPDLVIRN